MRRAVAGLFLTAFLTGAAWAQERGVWVQVEAQPTLAQAQERVRDYAARFPDVSGFSLGSGWYAIVLGPYAPEDARALLGRLRAAREIPGDSFIADGSRFRTQFWPVGTGAETAPQPLPGAAPIAAAAADLPPLPDETPRQAAASEELLTRGEREQIQIALQWAGYYDSTIDGAFGRGTRAAMAAWQAANGFEPTGILTTRQRAALLGAYNAVLADLDLQLVRDDATGIELMIPTAVVEFAAYDPPFARFTARDGGVAQVLLISQEGDANRLFGLYEIMQTLAIVPPEGPRARGRSSWELEGIGDGIHSYSYAALEDGQIKGFTLVWPEGDEERRARLLAEMKASFTRLPGVLDPAIAPPGEDQAVDLVSGLAVRQPVRARAGFFIAADGTVLTTTEAVAGCSKITLDDIHPAQVAFSDATLGIAVLRPEEALAPVGVAAFRSGVPRLQAEIAVAGYPYGGVLTRPALTFGRLADIRGLAGESHLDRLEVVAQPGDSGGPVFDTAGAVVGMLLPKSPANGQILPEEVNFAVDAGAIRAALSAAGIAVTTTDDVAFIPPEALTRRAYDMTVLVSCW